MSNSGDSQEWGIVARSFFWFVQASVLSGIAAVSLGARNSGAVGMVIALAASFLSVVLLFRQVNAIVEQKLESQN